MGVVIFFFRAVSKFGTVHTAEGGVVLSGTQRWGRSEVHSFCFDCFKRRNPEILDVWILYGVAGGYVFFLYELFCNAYIAKRPTMSYFERLEASITNI